VTTRRERLRWFELPVDRPSLKGRDSCLERLFMPLSFSIDLPRDPTASRLAREQVTDRFADTLDPPVMADVMLAVSELVTNAVLHGGGRIELRVEADDRSVKGEVVDAGRGLEQQIRDRGVDGSGLRIVGRVARRWGVFQGTTHVWFEIPLGGVADDQVDPTLGEPAAARLPDD